MTNKCSASNSLVLGLLNKNNTVWHVYLPTVLLPCRQAMRQHLRLLWLSWKPVKLEMSLDTPKFIILFFREYLRLKCWDDWGILKGFDFDFSVQEVLLSVYVVEPGQSSEALVSALAAAARRGVRLRLRTDRGQNASPWSNNGNSSWFLLVCQFLNVWQDGVCSIAQLWHSLNMFEVRTLCLLWEFPTVERSTVWRINCLCVSRQQMALNQDCSVLSSFTRLCEGWVKKRMCITSKFWTWENRSQRFDWKVFFRWN